MVFMASKLPKSRVISSARAPVGSPEPPGHKFYTTIINPNLKQKLLEIYLPENRMVEVSSTVELQRSMETNHRGDVLLGHGLGQLLLGHVEVVDVGGVVLAVVELHDLRADDGLQGVVVVGKVGQAVLPSLADGGKGGGV